MTNKKIEKIEKMLNDVLAKLFPVDEKETERINSARVTCSRLKAFDRTKMKTQYDLDAITLSQVKKQELTSVQTPNQGVENFTPQ